MATVYKPKGRKVYRIEFKDQHGVYKKISSGTKDRKIAESLAKKIEEDAGRRRAGMPPLHADITDVFLGLIVGAPVDRTWAAFRKRYETEYLGGLRARSAEKSRMVLDIFEKECQPKEVTDIDEKMVSMFVARLRERPIVKRGKATGRIGLAPWTIKNYLGALHTALTWAAAQKLIRAVPMFPVIKVPKLRPQPIDEADWQKLLKEAPNALWRAYLLCGWYGGLRLSEAYQLRRNRFEEWPWIDFPGDRIVLPARFVKANEDQWIPLHPELRAALATLPDQGDMVFPFRSRKTGEPLTRNGVTNNVIHLARKAGVKLSMHRLRKGFGCRVASQLGKGNAPVLHRLMRHSSMQITMDFYASVDGVLHDAIRQLDQSGKNCPSPAPLATRPPAGPPADPESEKGLAD